MPMALVEFKKASSCEMEGAEWGRRVREGQYNTHYCTFTSSALQIIVYITSLKTDNSVTLPTRLKSIH